MGGSGPVNKNINIAQFHGHGAEGFTDYSTSGKAGSSQTFEPYAGAGSPCRGDARLGVDRTTSFNPTAAIDMVHGNETIGLGTSTFLEGAPAARSAIERRDSEGDTGGLGRKKSLAQKIRGISNSRTIGARGGPGVYSAEPRGERTTSPNQVQSSGGLPKIAETNPFFSDYDDAPENKGIPVKITEDRNGGYAKGEKRGLERTATYDGISGSGQDEGKSGGFLSRVKSLRGGGRGKIGLERKV